MTAQRYREPGSAERARGRAGLKVYLLCPAGLAICSKFK